MPDDLLNILSDSNKDIDNQKIMDYISGKLSADQKHEVEKWMIDHPFVNEAIEGLQQSGDEKKLQATVEQLNVELRKYLQQRKRKREKFFSPVTMWTYVAIIFILAILVAVYVLIKLKS